MSKPLPELPDLLPGFAERLETRAEEVAAAHRAVPHARTDAGRRPRRWRLFGGGTLIAVLAVSGAYASGLWRPQLGSNPADSPSASARAVAPALLDRLAVLRRPQTESDRGSAAIAALRFPATSRAGIQTAAVRATNLDGGATAVLIPMIDEATGTQELCLVVLSDQQPGGRACATAAEVVAGELLLASEAPRSTSMEEERAARRREAQGTGTKGGGVQQDRTTAGRTRVIGVAPDGVRALWVGASGPAQPDANVFDVTTADVPTDLRARWDN